jgi:hypothetical protein
MSRNSSQHFKTTTFFPSMFEFLFGDGSVIIDAIRNIESDSQRSVWKGDHVF